MSRVVRQKVRPRPVVPPPRYQPYMDRETESSSSSSAYDDDSEPENISADLLIDALADDDILMMEELLPECSPQAVYTALMMAISRGKNYMTTMIIKHDKYKELDELVRLASVGSLGSEDLDEASTLIDDETLLHFYSPLMLAAMKEQFEIVELMVDRGDTILKPHKVQCKCQDCEKHPDQLKRARFRLNTYRGLCSHCYILLTSDDPLLRTLKLGQKLLHLAEVEDHYKSEYMQLKDQMSELAARILDLVRTDQELNTVLNEKYGSGLTSYESLARLKLAVRFGEKLFIAHPACQKKLVLLWRGVIKPTWVNGIFKTLLFMILMCAFYPVLMVLYMLCPVRKLSRFMHTPLIKFTANTLMYIVFVFIIVVLSVSDHVSMGWFLTEDTWVYSHYMEYRNSTAYPLIEDCRIRVYQLRPVTVVMCVWVGGFIWEMAIKIFQEGYRYFSDNIFNILNLAQITLYIISFVTRFYSLYMTEKAQYYFYKPEGWSNLTVNDSTAVAHAYWMCAERDKWAYNDPILISDAVSAIGSVLTICKVINVFIVHDRLGPLVINFGEMGKDVSAFCILFFIIMASFCLGLHNIYWFFYNGVPTPPGEEPVSQFTEFNRVLALCFWSIFGIGKFDNHNTFNVPTHTPGLTVLGDVLFGGYNMLMVVVLINMLIAMMSKTYTTVAEREDVEWKFARTKLFLEYIREGSTVPPPFNIVPTWRGAWLLLKKIYALITCKPCRKDDNGENIDSSKKQRKRGIKKQFSVFSKRQKLGKKKIKKPESAYQKLMVEIVKRYISSKDEQNREGAGIEQLKVDLHILKAEFAQHVTRQTQERAFLTTAVGRLRKRIQHLQDVFTRQRALRKATDDLRDKETIKNLAAVQAHVNIMFDSTMKHMGKFETQTCHELKGLRKSVAWNIKILSRANDSKIKTILHQREKMAAMDDVIVRQQSVLMELQKALTTVQAGPDVFNKRHT